MLTSGPLTLRVGRAADNEFVIDDASVSRHHLELTRAGEGWWMLRDLGSYNGTYLNGRRVDVGSAADGDLLLIGGTRLRVTSHGLEPELEAATTTSRRRLLSMSAAIGLPLLAALLVGAARGLGGTS